MEEKTSFYKQLIEALRGATSELFELIGGEKLYAFALYTSGESDFTYVCASANTEEGLERKITEYANRDASYKGETGQRRLRWSAPDWQYHNFSSKVEALDLPSGTGLFRDRRIYRNFASALKTIGGEGTFDKREHQAKTTLLILCGDMREAFLQKSLRSLNPKTVVENYILKYTSEPFFSKLDDLPREKLPTILIDLYKDLALDRETALAKEARRYEVYRPDLETRIARFGPKVVGRLLDIIEEFGFGEPFYSEESSNFKKYGAFTIETNLAVATTFLVGSIGRVSEDDIRRMQSILTRRICLDENMKITSTLSENIARILHKLRPKRFPDAQLNPSTNHLDNPEPFLP